jgi:hypothetical protein
MFNKEANFGYYVLFPVIVVIFFLFPGSITQAQTRRTLLVGINNYEPKQAVKSPCRDEWRNLRGCINDVEVMQAVLVSLQFGFKAENIHILKNEEATRERILSDIKKYLADEASPGDTCLFYYSGHGSRVKNSKSAEPDKMDETLVPADWYLGIGDIRDKELKKLYNRVLDKQAHLIVIVDACHSGSISRGIPVPLRNRSLPPNECDVAEPPDKEKSPAERGALIFSAAQDFQAALEIKDENNNWHGLFTWALIKTLREIRGAAAAQDLLLKVKALLQSEGKSQEPNLEGLPEKTKGSIFGIPTGRDSGPLKVFVSRVWKNLVELQGGLALGIREDCELKKLNGDKGYPAVRVRVTAVHGVNRCSASVIEGDVKNIKVGDGFILDKWVAAREARLQVFVPVSNYSYKDLTRIAADISELRNSSRIEWVEDPTEMNPTHIISWHQSYWRLETLKNDSSRIVKLGRSPGKDTILKEVLKNPVAQDIKPRVFLQLPLSVEMAGAVQAEMGDYNHSVEMSSSGGEDFQYILVGRLSHLLRAKSQELRANFQYAWVLPNMTQEQGQDFSLPVRTGWIAVEKEEPFQEIAEKLTGSVRQLVRIRAWYQLSSPPGNGRFPYYLALRNAETGEIKTAGPLIKGETYGLVLKADDTQMESAVNIERRYVYVFSIDSFGKGTLLFPRGVWGNAENYFPSTVDDQEDNSSPKNNEIKQKFFGGFQSNAQSAKRREQSGYTINAVHQAPSAMRLPPGEIQLGSEKIFEVAEPYGKDTFILLTTTDAISRPEVLDFSGVRKGEIPGLSPLEELLYDLTSGYRHTRSRPMIMNWSIQRLPILSKAK